MDEELESMCTTLRNEIRDLGAAVKDLMNHQDFKSEQSFAGQHSEMRANIMLTFRHMEDARMRIGKVMQQIQGGVSIYDKMENAGQETPQPEG